MMRARIRRCVVTLATITAACGTEPVFIAYDATVVSPNGLEGAAVLELDGSFAEAISVNAGRVFTQEGGGVTRVVLVRYFSDELTFTLTLDAAGRPPEARVLQVADGTNQLRGFLQRYRVEFTGVGQ